MRLHIVGASCSGTTTLGKALSQELHIPVFDSDDYFWEKTDPPFTTRCPKEERQRLLYEDISKQSSWIISGSLLKWGDFVIPFLDAVVFLYLDPHIRMQRLVEREKLRYGDRILEGNDMYEIHLAFVEWAKSYETGGLEHRSKASHEAWLASLPCKTIRIDEDINVEQKVTSIIHELSKSFEKYQVP